MIHKGEIFVAWTKEFGLVVGLQVSFYRYDYFKKLDEKLEVLGMIYTNIRSNTWS